MQEAIDKYYVYRFVNKDDVIVYVGSSTNMTKRFLNHMQLQDDIDRIEFIECESEAEMAWKEVYYINLFCNSLSKNKNNIFFGGGKLKDIGLQDKWKKFKFAYIEHYKINPSKEKYEKYVINAPKYDYSSLIHILDNYKLNQIGVSKYAISQKWFYDHENDEYMTRLKNNTLNFFRNYCSDDSSLNLWTTFGEFKENVKGDGFTKGFMELGKEPSKDTRNRIYLAYLANIFYPIKKKEYKINEDQFALTELMQFMFQSALIHGKEIWIYIPSIRMRTLLKKWIKENPLQTETSSPQTNPTQTENN